MNCYKKFLCALAVAVLSSVCATAQNEQSPYSKFGYGLVRDYATSMQRNMGGVGIAMSGGRQINVMNPASYASTDSLTLLWDIGLDVTRLWSKEGSGSSGTSFGGGLDYLTMQFPLGKYMGGSVGLVPYSSVGYSFGGNVNDNKGNVIGTSSYTGSGGINELYLGVGGRPFKGFTVGANIAYQFGTIVNDSYIVDGNGAANSLFEQSMEIRDWNLLLGVQYTKEFRQMHKFTIGATYSPKKEFHGKTWGTKYDINSDASPDTIGYTHLNGDYTKANSYGVGLSYTYDGRLTVEGDFSYQDWSKAKFGRIYDSQGIPASEATRFDDKWKTALGVQFVPKHRGSYFQRVAYRCGAYYTRDYILVGSNHVREYGASLGFGFPTLGTKTIINLGFEYKRRSAYPMSNLVSENYFNITLGINFNEMAFWKDKIR